MSQFARFVATLSSIHPLPRPIRLGRYFPVFSPKRETIFAVKLFYLLCIVLEEAFDCLSCWFILLFQTAANDGSCLPGNPDAFPFPADQAGYELCARPTGSGHPGLSTVCSPS